MLEKRSVPFECRGVCHLNTVDFCGHVKLLYLHLFRKYNGACLCRLQELPRSTYLQFMVFNAEERGV